MSKQLEELEKFIKENEHMFMDSQTLFLTALLTKIRQLKAEDEENVIEFTLGFGNFIGKNVTLKDDSEYYCGEHIDGRYYNGKFGGTVENDRGIWFIVDGKRIKVSHSTKIKFKH